MAPLVQAELFAGPQRRQPPNAAPMAPVAFAYGKADGRGKGEAGAYGGKADGRGKGEAGAYLHFRASRGGPE